MRNGKRQIFGSLVLALLSVALVVVAVSASDGGAETGAPITLSWGQSTQGRAQTGTPVTHTVYLPAVQRNYVDLTWGHPDYECYFPGYAHSSDQPWDNGGEALECSLLGIERGWHYVSGLAFPEGYDYDPADPPAGWPVDWWKMGVDDDYYGTVPGASHGQVLTVTVTPPEDMYIFVLYMEERQTMYNLWAESTHPGERVRLTYTVHLLDEEGVLQGHWVVVSGRPLLPQQTPEGEDFDTFYNWSAEPYDIEFSGGEADG